MSTITIQKPLLWTCLCVGTVLLIACQGEEVGPGTAPLAHQDNVFASQTNWYVNEAWTNNVLEEETEALAQHSTAVWIEKISDIEALAEGEITDLITLEDGGSPKDGLSLRDHLHRAHLQNNALVQLVLYNAPGRDCGNRFAGGELPIDEVGFSVYQNHFIDRVSRILTDYPHVPVALILEPHSLLPSVSQHTDEACQAVSNASPFGYTNSLRYAINRLSRHANVHIYLDIEGANSHGYNADIALSTLYVHGFLTGFDNVYEQAKSLAEYHESLDGATGQYQSVEAIFVEPPAPPASDELTPPASDELKPPAGDVSPPGYAKISGFVSNIGDYTPLEEPYLGDPLLGVGGDPLYSHYFYDWNPRFDEWGYTHDWLSQLRSHSADQTGHLGVLIDTSRNGWGQSHRRLAGTMQVNQDPEKVNEFRLDQREHRRNWCNQAGGVGRRPQATPDQKEWIHAYIWVKSPGRSDGPSNPDQLWDPNNPSRLQQVMCDPHELSTYGQARVSTADLNLGTGAMDGAPIVGQWFSDGFKTLIENAWPPLCEGYHDDC